MDLEFFKTLPSEVIIDILSRLPVGSITICKCVCKSWLGLLGTDEFVKVHRSRPVPCLVIGRQNLGIYELKDDIDLEHHEFHTDFKFDFPWPAHLAASANGLLFLVKIKVKGSGTPYVCNPLTREYVEIKPPIVTNVKVIYGFGASKMTGQHKVVAIYHNIGFTKFEFHVYTLETGLWRSIAPSDSLKYVCFKFGVFLNGNLHWLVFDSNRSLKISCFDLETELFSTFSYPLPPSGIGFYCDVSALDNCLCACENTRDDGMAIWLMKVYGVDKSWTKQIVISGPFGLDGLVCPIKVFRDGDILMVVNFSKLFCRSTKTKISREIGNGAILHTPTFLSLKSLGMENVNRARCEWLDARKINVANYDAHKPRRGCKGWHDLPLGWHRCGVDAAFFPSLNATGVGIILQDAKGTFIAAMVLTLPGCLRVEEGEAMGLHEALSWIKNKGIDCVEFHSDSKLVVDAIDSRDIDRSEFGAIIDSCRMLLQLCSTFRIKYARRDANVVAHRLARSSKDFPSTYVWDEPPSNVEGLRVAPWVCE